MTPVQKRDRILLQIETATSRYRWSQAAAKAKGSTPALKRFMHDSLKEWHALKVRLAKAKRLVKLDKLAKEVRIR
jgi:hypothetical protein